tara:strand:+ start:812 stop:1546 length:735 start_codon:yes stop_codon:yes gene_type:complete
MNNVAIIIPSRLQAKRLPNKPLKMINNKEMILHVHDAAVKAEEGIVYVASPDNKIVELVKKNGGKAILTSNNHLTGTDRVYEVFEKELNKEPEFIINLQGDMPNINPGAIKGLINHIKKKTCEIGTLASNLEKSDYLETNVVKVKTKNTIEQDFSEAVDFFRASNQNLDGFTYHHVGIYAFTNKALIRYVELKRSKLETERQLEQMRALENKMKIEVGFIKECPLSVDTGKDLEKIKKLMENNE